MVLRETLPAEPTAARLHLPEPAGEPGPVVQGRRLFALPRCDPGTRLRVYFAYCARRDARYLRTCGGSARPNPVAPRIPLPATSSRSAIRRVMPTATFRCRACACRTHVLREASGWMTPVPSAAASQHTRPQFCSARPLIKPTPYRETESSTLWRPTPPALSRAARLLPRRSSGHPRPPAGSGFDPGPRDHAVEAGKSDTRRREGRVRCHHAECRDPYRQARCDVVQDGGIVRTGDTRRLTVACGARFRLCSRLRSGLARGLRRDVRRRAPMRSGRHGVSVSAHWSGGSVPGGGSGSRGRDPGVLGEDLHPRQSGPNWTRPSALPTNCAPPGFGCPSWSTSTNDSAAASTWRPWPRS